MSTTASITSILIDQREPAQVVNEVQSTFPGTPLSVTLLQAGDVWLATSDGAMLVVERKTASDLLSSLRDGRLFAQASEMRSVSQWAYLVITGQLQCGSDGRVWYGREITGWNWDAVQGALLSVQEAGVGVVQSRGDGYFGEDLRRLAARSRETARVPPVRDMRITTAGEQVLSALPGIGIERAGAILDVCATPALALVSLTTHLSDKENPLAVPGIGAGIRAKVRQALGLPDDAELGINTTNGGNRDGDV